MAEHTVLGATTGRAFLLPLDEIIVAGLSPGIKFTGIHLVERGTVKVKSLSLNTTVCPQPGLKFKPLNTELKALTMRLMHLLQKHWGFKFLVMDCSYIQKSVVTVILSNLNARQNDITSSVLSEQLINELIHVRELHFLKTNNNISFSKTTFILSSIFLCNLM